MRTTPAFGALLAFTTLGLACSTSGLTNTTTDGGLGDGAWPIDLGRPPNSQPDLAPPSCAETHDGVTLSVVTPGNETIDCANPSSLTMPQTVTGQVTKVSGSQIEIDTCPPNADCISNLPFVVTVDAPRLGGLEPYVRLDSFVTVEWAIERPWGCLSRIVITSIATWGGAPNPVDNGGVVYLAASDGTSVALDSAPFTVEQVALGCNHGGGGCGSVPPDDYLLRFHATSSASTIDVPMGQVAEWLPGTGNFMLYNLRSFYSGACDDDFNWAWLAVTNTLGD